MGMWQENPRVTVYSRHMRRVPIPALFVIITISALGAVYDTTVGSGYDMAAYAQEYDTEQTLVAAIINDSTYAFQDDSGYGIMTGMVENRGPAYISGVRLQVSFYDDTKNTLLNVVSDKILVDVMPPYSKAPFLVRSSVPDLGVEHASARVIHFDSSPAKEPRLEIAFDTVQSYVINNNDINIVLSGSIANGPAPSSNTTLYVALHDAFDPPRTLDIVTINADDVKADESVEFELDEIVSSDVRAFSVYAESDIYRSDNNALVSSPVYSVQNMVVLPTSVGSISDQQQGRPSVIITDVALLDDSQNKVSSVSVGQYLTIQPSLLINFEDTMLHTETSYTTYVKIRDASESGPTEFIGMSHGTITDQRNQLQIIEWTAQNPGLYVVETFVWDANGIPIADRGPVLLVLVSD